MKGSFVLLLVLLASATVHAQERMKFEMLAEANPFVNFYKQDLTANKSYSYTLQPVQQTVGAALGLGFQGLKHRIFWGMMAGWQFNQTKFKWQHPEISSVHDEQKIASNQAFLKINIGMMLLKTASGGHLDFSVGAGAALNVSANKRGSEVFYHEYTFEGNAYQAPVAYVHYSFGQKNGEFRIIFLFSFARIINPKHCLGVLPCG